MTRNDANYTEFKTYILNNIHEAIGMEGNIENGIAVTPDGALYDGARFVDKHNVPGHILNIEKLYEIFVRKGNINISLSRAAAILREREYAKEDYTVSGNFLNYNHAKNFIIPVYPGDEHEAGNKLIVKTTLIDTSFEVMFPEGDHIVGIPVTHDIYNEWKNNKPDLSVADILKDAKNNIFRNALCSLSTEKKTYFPASNLPNANPFCGCVLVKVAGINAGIAIMLSDELLDRLGRMFGCGYYIVAPDTDGITCIPMSMEDESMLKEEVRNEYNCAESKGTAKYYFYQMSGSKHGTEAVATGNAEKTDEPDEDITAASMLKWGCCANNGCPMCEKTCCNDSDDTEDDDYCEDEYEDEYEDEDSEDCEEASKMNFNMSFGPGIMFCGTAETPEEAMELMKKLQENNKSLGSMPGVCIGGAASSPEEAMKMFQDMAKKFPIFSGNN